MSTETINSRVKLIVQNPKKKKLEQKAFSNHPCGSLWEGADCRGESTII